MRYENTCPEIALIFYSPDGQLEFDYELGPGANAEAIRLKTIVGHTSLNAAGDLVVRAGKLISLDWAPDFALQWNPPRRQHNLLGRTGRTP